MSYSKLTVSDLETLLSGYTPGGMTFMIALNQVIARFYDMGCFKNLAAKVVFSNGTSTGIITLPRRYESLVGLAMEDSAPLPIYGAFHEWQELSFGWIEPSEMSMNGVFDMQDGYPTFTDITTEGTIRIKIYDADDVGKVARIFGKGSVNGVTGQLVRDSNGAEGVNLTLASPTADTSATFSDLSPPEGGIQLPSNMVGMSELYIINSGTPTLLARYEPGETRPSYRRYKTGVVSNDDIIAFCKRRFVPFVNNTDFVEPANVGAIKFGLLALQKEDALNIVGTNGSEHFWSKARQLLELQLKSFRGSIKPRATFLGRELASGPMNVN